MAKWQWLLAAAPVSDGDLLNKPLSLLSLVMGSHLSGNRLTGSFNGSLSTGINLAFTKLLYENGCNVVIADLRPHPTANAFLDSIPGDARAKVLFRPTDVTIWSELEQVMQFAETHLGAVPDIVCPGAGVFEPVCTYMSVHTDSPYNLGLRVMH